MTKVLNKFTSAALATFMATSALLPASNTQAADPASPRKGTPSTAATQSTTMKTFKDTASKVDPVSLIKIDGLDARTFNKNDVVAAAGRYDTDKINIVIYGLDEDFKNDPLFQQTARSAKEIAFHNNAEFGRILLASSSKVDGKGNKIEERGVEMYFNGMRFPSQNAPLLKEKDKILFEMLNIHLIKIDGLDGKIDGIMNGKRLTPQDIKVLSLPELSQN